MTVGNKKTTKKKMSTVGLKIEALVLDMLQPCCGTGKVANMDNYYVSPMVAVKLLKNGVCMRGTCRSNRVGFPPGVMFTPTEAKNLGRGKIKWMHDPFHKIAALGWTDGNPVHFVTAADGIKLSKVERRIGQDKKSITAPTAVKLCNKGMQAVDRNDQLRTLFSMSSRHGFKKYHTKIALGLFDMSLVQGWCHFKLANPETAARPSARCHFTNDVADKLLTTNWNSYGGTPEGHRNSKVLGELLGTEPDETVNETTSAFRFLFAFS